MKEKQMIHVWSYMRRFKPAVVQNMSWTTTERGTVDHWWPVWVTSSAPSAWAVCAESRLFSSVPSHTNEVKHSESTAWKNQFSWSSLRLEIRSSLLLLNKPAYKLINMATCWDEWPKRIHPQGNQEPIQFILKLHKLIQTLMNLRSLM